jgi:SET domain-containing protein
MSLLIRASKIHSAGCYTTARIRKGAAIVEYTGARITVAEADARYSTRPETYLFGLSDGKHVIDGDGVAAFLNHCCDPNCKPEEVDGRVWIVALRDIAAGEELTYDYNLYDGDGDAPCFCQARNCRGSMYSAEELQKRKNPRRRNASKPRKPGRTAPLRSR